MMILALLACGPTGADDSSTPDDSTDDTPPCEGSGVVCTWAGSGIAALGKDGVALTESHLYLPLDMTYGPDGHMYFIDWNNHRIRRAETDGTVSTITGTGLLGDGPEGAAKPALWNHPTNLAFDADGLMWVAAWHNSRVETIDVDADTLKFAIGNGKRSYAGDGATADTTNTALDLPSSVAFASDGTLYITDQANQRVRAMGTDGIINSVIGNGTAAFSGDGGPASEASFYATKGQSAAPGNRIVIHDDVLYMADTQNQVIRAVDLGTMIIDTIAGTPSTPGTGGDGGPALSAKFFNPTDLAFGPDGELYVADTDNSCVRVIGTDGTIDTFAGICGVPGFEGDGGDPLDAKLNSPYGVEVDAAGNVYIADTYNHVIRVVYK